MQAACASFDLYDFMDDQVSSLQSSMFKRIDGFYFVENVDPSTLSESSVPLLVYAEGKQSVQEELTLTGEKLATQAKSMNINVEGWQLALAALTILGGSYLFAWDSHKSLLTELNSIRSEVRDDRKSFDEDLKKLINELKAERESDRQQANVNSEAVTAQLMKIHEAQGATTEALKSLRK